MHLSSAIKLALALLLTACSTASAAAGWNVTGTVEPQVLDLRVIVAVTDTDGHPVTGLTGRNFIVNYAVNPYLSPSLFKGQVDAASVQACRDGCYSLKFKPSDIAHSPTIVTAAVITVSDVRRAGSLGSPLTIEQKASVVLTPR